MLKSKLTNISMVFNALGNETRLLIIHYLINQNEDNIRVGKIKDTLGIPSSTLSHHLIVLSQTGVLKQHKKGREIYCSVNQKCLRDAIMVFDKECCLNL